MYPKYRTLTDREKAIVNNGCGPSWFTPKMKAFTDKYLFGWMFHAQCGHHDWGYVVGGSEKRRLHCDIKFGKAIIKDAVTQWFNALMALIIAPVFFLAVVFFGCLSFRYGPPLTKSQALEFARKKNEKSTS